MKTIPEILKLIKKQTSVFRIPSVTGISKNNDPYQVLISCILSLRTKDKTTIEASQRLFKVANNPNDMIELTAGSLQKIIYPVGFYRNKSRVILGASKVIIEDFKGKVPNRLEDLLRIKGVGRKTANLVLGLGYNIPAICVDTHVHRITNRLGWARTKDPEETEEALKKIISKRYWIALNTLLVAFGQNICVPISPYCSRCYVIRFCKKRGITKFR